MSKSEQRIRETTDSDVERALLDALREDRPPPEARERVFVALGLSGAAAAVAITAASKKTWLALFAKIGLASLAVALPLTLLLRREPPATPAAPAPIAVAAQRADPVVVEKATPAASAPATAAPVPSATHPARPATIPPAPAPSASVSASASASASGGPALSPLAEETKLLDEARASLSAGNYAATLARLDRRDTQFPNGLLGAEADLIRIEALMRSGDRATAAALADRIEERMPGTMHARRARALVKAP